MEKILEGLENQRNCTATSGLNALALLVKLLLMKPYPNLQKKKLEPEYDFIVIGAGSGGATCASRLSEHPTWSVLLLEAGGEEPQITQVPGLVKTDGMFGTAVEWDFKTEPHPEFCDGKPCTYGRGKMMGGCDGHNGMWYLRGNKVLYDNIHEQEIDGWSFEEVWPYYERRCNAHELQDDGTLLDLSVEQFPYIDKNVKIIFDAYRELGITEPDRNGIIKEGYMTTSKNGTRISVNRLYLEKKRCKRKNLHVETEAMVCKILIDPKEKRAFAVEVLTTQDGKQEKVVIKARKEIILSAGIINTAKLLQLSGIGPKNLLEKYDIPVIKDLPVGYNFLNHPVFHAVKLNLTTTSTIPPNCEAIKEDVRKYIDSKSGPLSSTGAFNSYLLTHSSGAINHDSPDLLFAFNPTIEGIGVDDPKFCTSYYNTLILGVMSGMTDGLGTVFIKSRDPLEAPAITPGCGPWDKHIIAKGLTVAHKMANGETFKKHGMKADNTPDPRCKDLEYASYDYWKCAMKGKLDLWLHGMGTCRMGPKDDSKSVTDNRCKVHGIDNLRVVDASICPNVTNANINSVVMMIAEKCSDFIIMKHLK